ncbi:hypothetical protein [Bradyrhizobium sp. BTAi1]|uniref:hypothetical protein n=1 Tax=Bradyrhizobium sp. (strain BTAi1 / ATCC BAA-1182) TaxID=288000 RepID=UPI00005DEB24|nr:hypothetical protein [Bradyrhizobium sp. BTAi1]ABQ35509.1 hypothetical protein BBta_3414 [Bradyrhizobium sp. BTAi1]
MRKQRSHLVLLLAVCLGIPLALPAGAAFARASSGSHDGPWNPDHIDQLPPDVQDEVLHRCRGHIQAAHYFATYLDRPRRIKLHYENLRCETEQSFKHGDGCLHEEFVSLGARHRLMKSYYAPCSD